MKLKDTEMIKVPDRCRHCGEYYPHFTWGYFISANGSVAVVYLGCDSCSETLMQMPLDEFLQVATQHLPVHLQMVTPP